VVEEKKKNIILFFFSLKKKFNRFKYHSHLGISFFTPFPNQPLTTVWSNPVLKE
jgi:hypothetical protein